MTTQATVTLQFTETETLVAYDNPFEAQITIVDTDTNDTVGRYVNWDAASVWFVIADEVTQDEQGNDSFVVTRRPVPPQHPGVGVANRHERHPLRVVFTLCKTPAPERTQTSCQPESHPQRRRPKNNKRNGNAN